MQNEWRPDAAILPDAGVAQVLLVTPAAAEPSWTPLSGAAFQLTIVTGISAALDHLTTTAYDAVIIEPAAAADAEDLQRLRMALDGAELLVLSNGSAVAHGIECPDDAACVLPTHAPADVQVQVVALAAERGRLKRLLARRTRELTQSRSRFRDVIERNADAIVVVDREGVIRFANNAAEALLHTHRDDLAGTPFGFPVTAGETTELDVLHPGGARVVEMRVEESEWEGEPAFIASLRDTTERRRAEESARRLIAERAARTEAEKAARRFRFQAEAGTALSAQVDYTAAITTLASLCTDEVADWAVIFAVDDHGSVRRVGAAHCTPELEPLVQQLRSSVALPDSGHPVLDVLRTRRPLLVSHVDDAQYNALAHDEQQLDVIRQLGITSYLIVPLIARGRALGAIQLVSSTADRHFTEEDLDWAGDLASRAALALDNARLYDDAQNANHAKSDLLAVISHDLRTPLNAIIGYSELLAMGIPEPLEDTSLMHVDRIAKSARHLLFLIDELSSFARLEAGRIEIRMQEASVQAIAHEVSAVMEPLARERGLAFTIQAPANPIVLRTDPDRVRQVLLNLTGNAMKYSQHGTVTLEIAPAHDGGAVFHVRDTGIGISADHLDRIFEPFWQVDSTERSSNRGTGLGLSIVRRLVTMLGGDVSVQSEPGNGSTFTVRLPPGPPR